MDMSLNIYEIFAHFLVS